MTKPFHVPVRLLIIKLWISFRDYNSDSFEDINLLAFVEFLIFQIIFPPFRYQGTWQN